MYFRLINEKKKILQNIVDTIVMSSQEDKYLWIPLSQIFKLNLSLAFNNIYIYIYLCNLGLYVTVSSYLS